MTEKKLKKTGWVWIDHSASPISPLMEDDTEITINNVLLVKIEGPVWYTIYIIIIIYLLLKG